MKITAAVVRTAASPFSIEQLELEEPRADEVLVRIAGAGVCHTDLVARDQALPVPLSAGRDQSRHRRAAPRSLYQARPDSLS